MSMDVIIYTDGACSGNPGPGGWGAVLMYGTHRKEIWGGEETTTNNRMELLAAIKALEALKTKCRVQLYTDSQYLQKGILLWMDTWKKKGWRTAGSKAVRNVDLWQKLDTLHKYHHITWHWVRGHANDIENERADYLARKGISSIRDL